MSTSVIPTRGPIGWTLHRQVWRAVCRSWRWPFALGFGGLFYGVGNAALAAAAGVLARWLAGAQMDLGSTPLVLRSGPDVALALALGGVFAALAKLVGGALASWAEARIASEVGAGCRLAVLEGVLGQGRSRGAEPINRVAALTTLVHEVEEGVGRGVLAELRAGAELAPLLVLMVVLAPRLALSGVVTLVAFGALAFGLRRAFRRAHARAITTGGALISAADEAVRHAELWATYGATRRIRSHVLGIGRTIAQQTAQIRVRASLMSSTSEVLGAMALVLVLLLAARGLLGVDHGLVVPFAIAFFMAYRPLRNLVDARIARARGEEALRLVGESARAAESLQGRARGRRAWSLEPLVLEGVSSARSSHAPITLTIPPGSVVAVVGPTGVGKTSLLRALLGLDPIARGSVRYGDVALSTSGVGPGERPFAWVPQDAPILMDSLAVNVGLGFADDDQELLDPEPILRELGGEDLARSLGALVLGPSARPVSGGERQWIAVARALATKLPVLLLDEPTSSLDEVSEAKLLEGLARLRGQRTVILVTHRPKPLAIADVTLRLSADEPRRAPSSHPGVTTSSTGPAVTSTVDAWNRSPSST